MSDGELARDWRADDDWDEPRTDNPARPPAGLRLCALEELADPGARGFRFQRDGALFNGFVLRRGGEVTGFVDWCPHMGLTLDTYQEFLTRDKRYLFCGAHNAIFNLEGVCIAGPCEQDRLRPWPVEVRDGGVFTL